MAREAGDFRLARRVADPLQVFGIDVLDHVHHGARDFLRRLGVGRKVELAEIVPFDALTLEIEQNALTLFESVPSPQGPSYVPIVRVPLGGPTGSG